MITWMKKSNLFNAYLDGKMLDEAAAFNTSALTGESIPRTIVKAGKSLPE